ncbi:MAG: pseudouridine synthase, partial [Ignavibacteria bacterium]
MKIQKKILIHIPPGQRKTRIDKYLASHIENSSRTKIQKAIESGFVLVNSKIVKPNYLVLPDDFINIELPYLPDKADILPENIPLDILFEDKYLMVVNKPPGMVTHPAYKNYSGTLVNALMYYMQITKSEKANDSEKSSRLSSLYGLERAGIVHRLDKDTSGLLVVAKNEDVHRKLSLLFSKHNVEREYCALVWGLFKIKKGIIEKPLGRSHKDRKKVVVSKEGKSAVTEYEVIKEFDFLS